LPTLTNSESKIQQTRPHIQYECGHCGGLFDKSYVSYIFFVDVDKSEDSSEEFVG